MTRTLLRGSEQYIRSLYTHLMQMMQPVCLHFWQQWATSFELAELQLLYLWWQHFHAAFHSLCNATCSCAVCVLVIMQVRHSFIKEPIANRYSTYVTLRFCIACTSLQLTPSMPNFYLCRRATGCAHHERVRQAAHYERVCQATYSKVEKEGDKACFKH